MKELSQEAKLERTPLPPGYFIGALNEPVHKEAGKVRAVKAVRVKTCLKRLFN